MNSQQPMTFTPNAYQQPQTAAMPTMNNWASSPPVNSHSMPPGPPSNQQVILSPFGRRLFGFVIVSTLREVHSLETHLPSIVNYDLKYNMKFFFSV